LHSPGLSKNIPDSPPEIRTLTLFTTKKKQQIRATIPGDDYPAVLCCAPTLVIAIGIG